MKLIMWCRLRPLDQVSILGFRSLENAIAEGEAGTAPSRSTGDDGQTDGRTTEDISLCEFIRRGGSMSFKIHPVMMT